MHNFYLAMSGHDDHTRRSHDPHLLEEGREVEAAAAAAAAACLRGGDGKSAGARHVRREPAATA